MKESVRRTDVWLWLALPIAILLAIAATGGITRQIHYPRIEFFR